MKTKSLKLIAFTAFSILLTGNVYSQGKTFIHFGPASPVSAFGSDDLENEEAGGAALGVNVGLQYVYPLSQTGFGLFGGIDLNYNDLKKDMKDDFKESLEAGGIYNPTIKYTSYYNIPLTAGLNYTYTADKKIGVFANAGLAVNYLRLTNMEVSTNGMTITQEMKSSNGIGFKIGGGLLIKQNTTISIDYLGLGKHDLEGKITSTAFSEEQDIDGEQKIDILTLTLGFRF